MALKRIVQLTKSDIDARIRVVESGCWEWVGKPFQRSGYCRIKVSGKTIVAHRAVYEALVGPIPISLQIDHLCRNRRCVNPAHLEPVTAKENQSRGTSPASRNAAKTHCMRGHALAGRNLLIRPDGRRRCQVCERDAQRRLRQKPGARERHAAYERARKQRIKEMARETA